MRCFGAAYKILDLLSLCSNILQRKKYNKEESQAKPPSTNTCPRWAVRKRQNTDTTNTRNYKQRKRTFLD